MSAIAESDLKTSYDFVDSTIEISEEQLPIKDASSMLGQHSIVMRVVDDDEELRSLGVLRVPLPTELDGEYWSNELSKVTPMIMTAEGDGSYPFYRNILEETEFPFDMLWNHFSRYLREYFQVAQGPEDDMKLDDAFCIHYNMTQKDTSGAKHTDPSDITINLCLFTSRDFQGSWVKFYGTVPLVWKTNHPKTLETIFAVRQIPGFATIHWGHQPHETTPLEAGHRTNIVLTYQFCDPNKSGTAGRSCYFT